LLLAELLLLLRLQLVWRYCGQLQKPMQRRQHRLPAAVPNGQQLQLVHERNQGADLCGPLLGRYCC
jgi:hypothetical protein